jgi:hypothetical protein
MNPAITIASDSAAKQDADSPQVQETSIGKWAESAGYEVVVYVTAEQVRRADSQR